MSIKKATVLLAIIAIALILGGALLDKLNITQKLRASIKSKMAQDFGGQANPSTHSVTQDTRTPIFAFALLSDSHNNVQAVKAAVQKINNSNIDFTVGLGDYTDVGTTQELQSIKQPLNNLRSPFYSLPGDHDLWNGRDKTEDPLTYYRQEFGDKPLSMQHQNLTFIFLDNADLYKGVSEASIESFSQEIASASTNTIVILSHKAIYHPLTIHRMGYIQDEKNTTVSAQAQQIINKVTAQSDKNIYMIHGDLHSSSTFKGPNDNITNFTIGSLAKDKNFQTPRFAIARVYADGTIKIEDVELVD